MFAEQSILTGGEQSRDSPDARRLDSLGRRGAIGYLYFTAVTLTSISRIPLTPMFPNGGTLGLRAWHDTFTVRGNIMPVPGTISTRSSHSIRSLVSPRDAMTFVTAEFCRRAKFSGTVVTSQPLSADCRSPSACVPPVCAFACKVTVISSAIAQPLALEINTAVATATKTIAKIANKKGTVKCLLHCDWQNPQLQFGIYARGADTRAEQFRMLAPSWPASRNAYTRRNCSIRSRSSWSAGLNATSRGGRPAT
jgi:hypothetical protein